MWRRAYTSAHCFAPVRSTKPDRSATRADFAGVMRDRADQHVAPLLLIPAIACRGVNQPADHRAWFGFALERPMVVRSPQGPNAPTPFYRDALRALKHEGEADVHHDKPRRSATSHEYRAPAGV